MEVQLLSSLILAIDKEVVNFMAQLFHSWGKKSPGTIEFVNTTTRETKEQMGR
jgi:hypothetical protein